MIGPGMLPLGMFSLGIVVSGDDYPQMTLFQVFFSLYPDNLTSIKPGTFSTPATGVDDPSNENPDVEITGKLGVRMIELEWML